MGNGQRELFALSVLLGVTVRVASDAAVEKPNGEAMVNVIEEGEVEVEEEQIAKIVHRNMSHWTICEVINRDGLADDDAPLADGIIAR